MVRVQYIHTYRYILMASKNSKSIWLPLVEVTIETLFYKVVLSPEALQNNARPMHASLSLQSQPPNNCQITYEQCTSAPKMFQCREFQVESVDLLLFWNCNVYFRLLLE